MTVPSTINWTQVQTRPTLMIPGPTELPFPVIQAMNQPSVIQYDRSFDEGVLEPTTLALRDVFQTKSEVIIMPGSGRTALEAGALSIIEPGDRVLDVRTDEWGVDLNMTGSQKCLAAPLGMALVSVSPRAWRAMEQRKKKAQSYAYDLLRWRDNWVPVSRGGKIPDGTPRRQPISIPTHLTAALQVAVRLILEEGMTNRARRHAIAGGALRAGVAAIGLEMVPEPTLVSNTVACIRAPKGVEPAAVVRRMREQYGILIGTGLDKIRTSTLRIGTMGITASPHYVLPTLSALELALRDLGYKSQPGAGVAAAQAAFAEAA